MIPIKMIQQQCVIILQSYQYQQNFQINLSIAVSENQTVDELLLLFPLMRKSTTERTEK